MAKIIQRAPSPATVLAVVALFAALSGSAYALKGRNSVKSNDIAKGAVKKQDLHRAAVRTGKIAPGAVKKGKLASNSVTSPKIADSSIAANDIASNAVGNSEMQLVAVFKGGVVPAAADQGSAPRVELGTVGPFKFYGKCFKAAGNVVERTYIELTTGTAILSTEDSDDFASNTSGYLKPTSSEDDRELEANVSAGANAFDAEANNEEFQAAASNGTRITGLASGAGAKQGTPPDGDGPFLAGDSCIVGTVAVFGS